MTLPSLLWAHDGISERESAHIWPTGQRDNASWEDCTWDSALMWYRLVYDSSVPSTHYEAERLRQASGKGPLGGSNVYDVRRGIQARYHVAVAQPISGWSTLRLALGVGYTAEVAGRMGAFAAGDRLRRFDPSFTGAHAIHVAKVDAAPRYWVTDPLAPEDWDGEWWTADELRRFVQAGNLSFYHLVGKIKPKPSPSAVLTLAQFNARYRADVIERAKAAGKDYTTETVNATIAANYAKYLQNR